MVVTVSLAVREIQLASSASITAGAYVGYSMSADGSGEKRTIAMYFANRTAVVSQSFTDSPLASRNLYTVSGCLGSQGPLYCPQCPRIIRADVVDNGDSTYSAVFTGTRKGQYTVVTSLVSAGGLTSTYYNDLDSTVSLNFGEGYPQSSRVDNILDWSSADGSLPTSLSGSKVSLLSPPLPALCTDFFLLPVRSSLGRICAAIASTAVHVLDESVQHWQPRAREALG